MMEWITNANTIAGLVVAIFGIGGYIFAITAYLKGKAEKSLKESRPLPNVRYVKTDDVVFDRADWFNAFAKGFWFFAMGNVDMADMAPFFMGCLLTPLIVGMACGIIAVLFLVIFSFLFSWTDDHAIKGAFVVGLVLWGTVLLGVYIHFVGVAVEKITKKKREPIQQPTLYTRPTQYRRK